MLDLPHYIDKYREALLYDVVPFWATYSLDDEHGGFFTSLDRHGNVYDRDKFVWLQCRQVWFFALFYNRVSQRQKWLDIALHGAHFLEKFGRDEQGHWYFSLAADGSPLVQPYNIFSDCFAAMAFGQLGLASGQEKYNDIARTTFEQILTRRDNPKGRYSKSYPGTRTLKDLALPMILSNLALELEHLLDRRLVESTMSYALYEVMEIFYRKDLRVILENVSSDGSFSDTFAGRLTCPGHGLESMWFAMEVGVRNQNRMLVEKAKNIALNIVEYGWDQEFGGIFYFLDVKGYPLERLDWDQKLWWVHQEAALALLKGYAYTRDRRCWDWFRRIDAYAWNHFADPQFGEWYGYLNRRGEVLLPLKGGKWKGCFHTPRFLYQGWKTLQAIQGNVMPSAG